MPTVPLLEMALASLALAAAVVFVGMLALVWFGKRRSVDRAKTRIVVMWTVAGVLIFGLIQVYVNWAHQPSRQLLGLDLYGLLGGGMCGAVYVWGTFGARKDGDTGLTPPPGYGDRFADRPVRPPDAVRPDEDPP